MKSTDSKIVKRIRGKGHGSIVFQQDFADCGTPLAIKSTFHRLYTNGMLLRLAHGIYYYPKDDREWGLGTLYPSYDQVAEAIAKRDKAKIIPTGAHALNILGLSTQVPMNFVYITSGTPRRINIGGGKGILFRHSSSGKLFSFKSNIMLLVMMAMKEIGEKELTEEQLVVVQQHLDLVSASEFNHDIKLMPTWTRQILMRKNAAD